MNLVRCYYCGNPGTVRRPLVYDGDGRIDHLHGPCFKARDEAGVPVWLDDDTPQCRHDDCAIDEHDRACPDLPDGWATCIECERAAADKDLIETAIVMTFAGGRQRKQTVHVCRGTCLAQKQYGGGAIGDADVRVEHPIFGHRHPKREAIPTRRDDDQERDPGADRKAADQARADAMSDEAWVGVPDLEGLWGVSTRTARTIIARLLDAGLIEARDEDTGAGGTPRKVYRRCVQ